LDPRHLRRRPRQRHAPHPSASPHASATLTASAPGTGDGTYDYALTHDRELAAAATAALMARIAT